MALRTLYLVVACVLSVFDIGPVLDEDGNPRVPKIEFDSTTVRYVFFLEPSWIHAAADVDRLVTPYQESQSFRMCYQASLRGRDKAGAGNLQQDGLQSVISKTVKPLWGIDLYRHAAPLVSRHVVMLELTHLVGI